MQPKLYTVGEVAAATGLTVRTLQHYDNIGLLPVSGRTEGGRRLYTQIDLLKLEQIIFYRSIGISLKNMKEKLNNPQSLSELESVLVGHQRALLQKINTLNFSMSLLDSSLEVIKTGKYPPWEMLTSLIRMMDGSSLFDWTTFEFDSKLYQTLDEQGIATMSAAVELYHSIHALMVEAITLQAVNTTPGDAAAQKLAARWWNLIMDLTNGDENRVSAFSTMNDARETWPAAERSLFEKAETFLETALETYIRENNIPVPELLTDEERE